MGIMYFFISNNTKVFLPKNCHRENEFFLCTTQVTTRNPKNSNPFLNALNMKFSVDSVKRGKIVRSNKKRTIFYNKICLFLSLIGLLETSFLTLSKINGQSVICSNQNCSIVLSSVFSSFLDIPFSTIGLIFYWFLFRFRLRTNFKNNLSMVLFIYFFIGNNFDIFDFKSFFLSIFFMAILVFIINCFNIIELQTY